MEGINAIVTGELLSLSEQELIDCEKQDSGCEGGWMDDAFKFIEEHGLTLEEEYKYIAEDERCKKDKENDVYVTIDSYADVAENEPALVKAAAKQVSHCFQVTQYKKVVLLPHYLKLFVHMLHDLPAT